MATAPVRRNSDINTSLPAGLCPSSPPSSGAPAVSGCAFDSDNRGIAVAGDGFAHLEAEPGDRMVGEQALGYPFGRGLDEPELARADHRGDGLGHRGVVEGVVQLVSRGGCAHVGGHVDVEDEGLLDVPFPGVHADDRRDGQPPERNRVHLAHGTDAD